MKKIIAVALSIVAVLSMAGCGASNDVSAEKKQISIAYQYGLAYAPVIIAQQQQLIEKHYKELTGEDVEVTWTQMSAGADINTGISSGTVQAGFMGIGPAVTGVTKGVGYKIFTGLSGQEHGLMTNDSSITSLGDIIGSGKQIALVNIGSIQHVILAKALVANGYDAHALDSNIVAMKHPDGMTALETGNVTLHLTSNPYIYKEREESGLTELPEVSEVWSAEDNTFIVGVASESLYAENPKLYEALCLGIKEGIDLVNSDVSAAADITAELDGNTKEDEVKYMQLGGYSEETKGVFELSKFMADNAFIDSAPASFSDLAFDNVKGN